MSACYGWCWWGVNPSSCLLHYITASLTQYLVNMFVLVYVRVKFTQLSFPWLDLPSNSFAQLYSLSLSLASLLTSASLSISHITAAHEDRKRIQFLSLSLSLPLSPSPISLSLLCLLTWFKWPLFLHCLPLFMFHSIVQRVFACICLIFLSSSYYSCSLTHSACHWFTCNCGPFSSPNCKGVCADAFFLFVCVNCVTDAKQMFSSNSAIFYLAFYPSFFCPSSIGMSLSSSRSLCVIFLTVRFCWDITLTCVSAFGQVQGGGCARCEMKEQKNTLQREKNEYKWCGCFCFYLFLFTCAAAVTADKWVADWDKYNWQLQLRSSLVLLEVDFSLASTDPVNSEVGPCVWRSKCPWKGGTGREDEDEEKSELFVFSQSRITEAQVQIG